MPTEISNPSRTPSSSESGERGLVPRLCSSLLFKPSWSKSLSPVGDSLFMFSFLTDADSLESGVRIRVVEVVVDVVVDKLLPKKDKVVEVVDVLVVVVVVEDDLEAGSKLIFSLQSLMPVSITIANRRPVTDTLGSLMNELTVMVMNRLLFV